MRNRRSIARPRRGRLLARIALPFLLLTAATAAEAQTHLGTDFWFANNPHSAGGGSTFRIRIVNPGTTPADVTIFNTSVGTTVDTVAPGGVEEFVFPSLHSDTAGEIISTTPVWHVTSTSDVGVFVHVRDDIFVTNDSTLILPAPWLGSTYRVANYVNPTSSNGPYLGAVAVSPGTTNVQLYDATGALVSSVSLSEGQYFQRLNNPTTFAEPEDEMTGWRIVSDQHVAAFSGMKATSIGTGTAADIIFEQLLDELRASQGFPVAPTRTRPVGCTTPDTCAPDVFRFVATQDDTTIVTTPPVGTGVLDAGEYLEFATSELFVLTADRPIHGFRYLISKETVIGTYPAPATGDPAVINITPPEYWRKDYMFFSDGNYDDNFINITAREGTDFLLDGLPVTAPCEPIGTLEGVPYCAVRLAVTAGLHTIENDTTDNAFGLDVTGFRSFGSYGHPGGLGIDCVPGADGFIKDQPIDTGEEPNPYFPTWVSFDMWVRNAPDPFLLYEHEHQDPIVSTTNYVYVKLRNRGCDALTAGDVIAYFGQSATTFGWDEDWVGDFPYGDVIGSQPTGVLYFNDKVVLEFPWTPVLTGHFCLLARLDSVQDPMTIPESVSTTANVKNNNNIASKNVFVVPEVVGVMKPFAPIVRNIEQTPATIDLVFGDPSDPLQTSFLRNGDVTVDLTQAMHALWVAGGSHSQGLTPIPNTTSFTVDAPYARLDDITLASREEHPVTLTFQHFGSGPNQRVDPFVMAQWSAGGTGPDGGLTYVFPLPGEISPSISSMPLQFTDPVTLEWSVAAESNAQWFNLYRGEASLLPAGDYGMCLQPDLPTNMTTDTATPPQGVAWTYLVTGEGAGGEGSPGTRSNGVPRTLTAPCP